jgi:hypothetical protein
MATDGTTAIFAGAGHWVAKSGSKYTGGLFRRYAGDGNWEPLTAGLPENVEARAFAVHPTKPGVIYAGTQDGPTARPTVARAGSDSGFPIAAR